MSTPTPEELQRQITANTRSNEQLMDTIERLMHQFIEPSAEQASSSFERLEDIVETTTTHIGQNAKSIKSLIDLLSALGENLERARSLLEETRAIVAENTSQMAQLRTKLDCVARIETHEQQIAELRASEAKSRTEVEALKELVLSKLTGSIGN